MVQVAHGRLSKMHRSRLMHQMKARSRPELSRIAGKLKLVPERPQHS
jgi:DNA-binding CsgD family transcriptional regulator